MSTLIVEISNVIMLVMALSIDTFAASLLYGSSKVKIPFFSTIIINVICSFLLLLSILAGNMAKEFIPVETTKWISFFLLFSIAGFKLFDSSIKAFIKQKQFFLKKIAFSISGLYMVINIYADPNNADVDESHDISPKEAVALALALSFDGLGVGFGAALSHINLPITFLLSFIIGIFAVKTGVQMGNKLASKTEKNLSWISGLLMMLFAFSRIF